MCRGLTFTLIVVASVSLWAQPRPYPVYTEYHLDRTMSLVGRNFAGATESLAEGEFTTAKQRFARAREQIAVSITFWRHNERDDAIAMLRVVIETLDELDAALSANEVDADVAGDLAEQTSAGCDACHLVYRDQDPATNAYRLKPGSV